MKLLIEIDDEIVESAKTSPNYYPTYHFEKIWIAIVKGTPLPKGHGRLIDADELKGCVVDEVTMPYVPIRRIGDAPAIIEADKEGE